MYALNSELKVNSLSQMIRQKVFELFDAILSHSSLLIETLGFEEGNSLTNYVATTDSKAIFNNHRSIFYSLIKRCFAI